MGVRVWGWVWGLGLGFQVFGFYGVGRTVRCRLSGLELDGLKGAAFRIQRKGLNGVDRLRAVEDNTIWRPGQSGDLAGV